MSDVSRRGLMKGAALTGGALALPAIGVVSTATAAEAAVTEGTEEAAAQAAARPVAAPITVTPADPRYKGLISGSNQRWVGTPDYVRIVSSADQVVRAVQEAVDKGLKVVVRSGGHCDEDFTTNSEVKVVIEMSGMNDISYDAERRAIAVEPGALLGTVYRTLYKRWGVVLPGGTCPTVGAGGHIQGGGYGALSRSRGLTVDHLYAVEVVHVDRGGRARKVVATREANDPNRELWWAHTGAGGGNFGVVTRYWLRSPGATGDDPSRLLPKAPSEVLLSDVSWSWADLDEASFTRLARNFTAWHEANSAPDSPGRFLYSQFKAMHKAAGYFRMSTQVDAGAPDPEGLLDSFLAAVSEGTGVRYHVGDRYRAPWLYAVTEWSGFVEAAVPRWKSKAAYVRKTMPQDQLKALYRQLTRDDYAGPYGMTAIVSFGGKINEVGAGDTATAQRDSVAKMLYCALWTDPTQDEPNQRWVREAYADVYASTGGVPRTGGVNDGCYINYADADIADPAFNTSGTPWHQLYFKGNYPRLQQVKAKWDPRNVFSHRLSIQLP
ncbi:FAD-binding oxidoreductase [Streptomyces sp. RerS4]|uniref:FAD-binding oxidoreductase n=1 Tax=Streptomyces sp. RerS4 TaxID=2942449 RepID=UPI00201B9DB5|nr:FAD-binding oxidoreductase [Streptomyces sp. RerS4]UQX05325.1 FAD-binding oxidoreductase [Streptomyces sp. RerS4]